MKDEKSSKPRISGRWISVAIAVVYGIVARIAFGVASASDLVSTMSWGFITLVPLAIGALSVYFAPDNERYDYEYAMKAAFGSSVLFLAIALVLVFEVFICILMAAPIFLVVSIIGARLMCYVLRRRDGNYSVLVMLLILPYLISPMENRIAAPNDIRLVETQILINASAETVWENIIRVAEIMPSEQRFDFFHLAGIPRPVEAQLLSEGVGGIRHGIFDNGLMFIETITEWQPMQSISFDIRTEGGANVPMPFNEIGGRFFEVLDANYTLEVVGENQVLLHLSSHHRLSTRFNFYGGLWTDWMLRDFQDYVLGIVKARCEGQQ